MQNIIKESYRIWEGVMTHEPPKNTITLWGPYLSMSL